MKVFIIVAAVLFPLPAFAQGVELGPGGVWIDPGYHRGQHRAYGSKCRVLRQACLHKEELGEEGMGHCRRYRQACRQY
jgi:hypothetical protein